MPRVIGIDPGTLSIDLCGLDDGRVFLDESLPTSRALDEPEAVVARIARAGAVDLVAGPSGYGLPLVSARDLSDNDLRLACLAAEGERGGIGGLRRFMRTLARSSTPVVLTPGVIHLPSVPDFRKANRIDMGTADKVCAAALAVHELATRDKTTPDRVSAIVLELGGAFSAALALDHGRIVDGLGGTSGPIGMRGAGALDGEVAFLAGTVSKDLLFSGGAASIAGAPDASAELLEAAPDGRGKTAWAAYVESAVKAVATLRVSAPGAKDIVLSGRVVRTARIADAIASRIADAIPGTSVHVLEGFARIAKQAAQGAALIADGLAGGRSKPLVDVLQMREARGTVLDHLYVISTQTARARLGMA